jgi:sugar phosphate isomerase/epimerase
MATSEPQRLGIGLCADGLAYTCGFVGRGTPLANRNPLTMPALLDLAAELNLRWVEVPGHQLRDGDAEALRARAAELNLELVYGGGLLRAESFAAELETAHRLGARVARCILSGILEGKRAAFGVERWDEVLDEAVRALRALSPRATDLGLRIAVENHQDVTSYELARLCESVAHPAVGVCLDCGNALAVAEHPTAFAARVAPWIVSLHLKDYRLLRADDGYRLGHCAIGDGVVDFAAIFALLADRPEVPRDIEMAWHGERYIRVLDPAWWEGFPPRASGDWLDLLRLWHDTEVDEDWRTPFVTGEVDDLVAWERKRLLGSVANLAALVGGRLSA